MFADDASRNQLSAGARREPDPGTVLAARDGDARALDVLLAEVVPLVYNIVGRALDGHADVDDVVQETLLRVVRGIGGLREPEAFRSWLVAIAVRQVRDREQQRHRAFVRSSALDEVRDLPDPASDFVMEGIGRLSVADRRRVVTSAARWLDAENRALLALWWLEEIGELERPDLAAALGVSPRHAAVRILRMKEQMQSSCMVVKALHGRADCRRLRELTRGWDGRPSALWRKRVARHVRECDDCWQRVGDLLPVEGLVRAVPLLPVPVDLARRSCTAALRVNGAAHSGLSGSGISSGAARHLTRGLTRRPRGLFGVLGHGGLLPVTLAAVTAGAVVGTLIAMRPAAAPAAAPTSAPYHATASHSAAPVSASASSAPSPSPATASAAASTTLIAAAPPAAAPAGKKGVGVWSFNGVGSALAQSRADWYYTWSTQHGGVDTPAGASFVPMIWGPGSVTATALAQAKAAGPYLLGFNEPDMAAQSNMTVDQALSLWPQLMASGRILGSPAVATGAATPGGWLDQFMSGAQAKGYRVDFITLHWYGGDFNTTDAVSQLKSYIQAVYARYHKPIWLTEYALIDFSHGAAYPTDQQQAAFITASTQMLAALPYLQRYAWFGLGASDTGPSTGLFRSGPAVTPEGKAFEAAAGG